MNNTKGRALAIIPARAGSKRLPDKNIRLFCGQPLINWTIRAAVESQCFVEIMVSTDSAAIAEMARSCGAWVPFLRPAVLASDTASSMDVVFNVVDQLQNDFMRCYDRIALLQPTSPLRQAHDIKRAFGIMDQRGWASVVSICELDHPREWEGLVSSDGSLEGFFDGSSTPTAGTDHYFRLNGALYLARTEALREARSFFMGSQTAPLIMPRERSIDIDTALDFAVAETLMSFDSQQSERS